MPMLPEDQELVDAALADGGWDDQIDALVEDARGFHDTVNSLESAAHASGPPPTRAEIANQYVNQRRGVLHSPMPPQPQQQAPTGNVTVNIPPRRSPMLLEVTRTDNAGCHIIKRAKLSPGPAARVTIERTAPGIITAKLTRTIAGAQGSLRPGYALTLNIGGH
jgi:hypothetical protein